MASTFPISCSYSNINPWLEYKKVIVLTTVIPSGHQLAQSATNLQFCIIPSRQEKIWRYWSE